MLRRTLIIAPGFLLLLAALVVGSLYWLAKRAEPSYSGERELVGLAVPVRVEFGPYAVPTIEASNLEDLLFAQGLVVAGERMWQMDLLRRLAGGRLAEVMGAEALPLDRLFRTLGLDQIARRSYAALEPRYQEMLEAYAAGVNAYQREAQGRLPLEYWLGRFRPEPWRPEDSLLVAAYMSWILSFNVREELTFLRLAARVGTERAAELFPTDVGVPAPPPAAALPELSDESAAALVRLTTLPARYGLPIPGAASNGWAVAGPLTAEGDVLLANDPHLATSMPGTWYELELICPGLHVAGVALPGVPLVLIGHNAELAWGFTTTMADTQDLFVERVTDDGDHVERPGKRREPFRQRVERIAVAGRDTPVALTVRSTSHGVILNDVLGTAGGSQLGLPDPGSDYLLALSWSSGVVDRSFAALYRLNTATSIAAARGAIRDFRLASQNLMVAERGGGIGWQVSGLLPRRGRGLGVFPLPGWVEGAGWQGYVPVESNPGVTDPPAGRLITANNRTVPLDHPVNVGRTWMPPFRAERIAELLTSRIPITAAEMAAMQLDRVSVQARLYQEALRRVGSELRRIDAAAWSIAAPLLAWNGEMGRDSRPAALLARLEPALYESLYGDELGEDLKLLMDLSTSTYGALHEAVASGQSSFWDDVTTPDPEGPAEIWARALLGAAAKAEGQALGALRAVRFAHAFDRIPVLGRLFSVGPIGIGGYSHTINVAKGTPSAPAEALFVPSLRVVYTPADWTGTRGVLPLGQSGHLFSPYRTDQLEDWRAGRLHRWPWHGPSDESTIGTLSLQPAASP